MQASYNKRLNFASDTIEENCAASLQTEIDFWMCKGDCKKELNYFSSQSE